MRLNRLLASVAIVLVGCGEEMMTAETSTSLATPYIEATVSGNPWTGTPAHVELMGRNFIIGFSSNTALFMAIGGSQAGTYKCDLGNPEAMSFQENGKVVDAQNGVGTCRIEISQFGTVGQLIEGRFEGTLISSSNGSTVAITQGSFSVPHAP